MYQIICQAKQIKFIIKLYKNQNILLDNHATYQKAGSLRAASISKSHNTVNNNSIFNTKHADFSTKW